MVASVATFGTFVCFLNLYSVRFLGFSSVFSNSSDNNNKNLVFLYHPLKINTNNHNDKQ